VIVRPGRADALVRAGGGGRARWRDEAGLQAPGGVEVVTRPDHPHGRRGRVAVGGAEVAAQRFDQPSVGRGVGRQRIRHGLPSDEPARERLVPLHQRRTARLYFATGLTGVARSAPVLTGPHVQDRIGGEA